MGAGGREVGNEGVKLSLRRQRGWRAGVSVFVFVSYHPIPFLIGNKLNWFSPSNFWFARDGNRWTIILTYELFQTILSPCPVQEGGWASGRAGVWPLTKVNPPQYCTAGFAELDMWSTESLLQRDGLLSKVCKVIINVRLLRSSSSL